jgi:CYTH domain-containing protein
MTVVRRFLIASSLARLISRERGSRPIIEGYFAAQQGRVSYVVQDGERSQLVLGSEPTGSALIEERTDIPPAHAEALLNVCAGRVTYERSAVPIDDGAEVLIDRMSEPGVINIVTVEFHYPEEAEAFTPLTWFGPEITSEARFSGQMIAMNGPPQVEEVQLSNSTVEAMLDLLEGRHSAVEPVPAPAPRSAVDDSVLDALRRLSTSSFVRRPTTAAEGQAASPDAEMPDVDRRPNYAPEAQEASDAAEPDEARPVDADEASRPSTERSIRSRLFPRLTH